MGEYLMAMDAKERALHRGAVLDEVLAVIKDERKYLDLQLVGRGHGYVVDLDRLKARIERLRDGQERTNGTS